METLIDEVLTLARNREDVREMEPVPLEPVAQNCWGTVTTDGPSLAVGAMAGRSWRPRATPAPDSR